ncbi:BS17 [Porphyromonas macacae]|uniref:Small ribosomal subunit protein bS16 n=2 Tax=Porphyromonas macacae TaxID=28115 RepID=A0A379E7C4_9PORP|nr:BS17 [Porphyromonas macacae]
MRGYLRNHLIIHIFVPATYSNKLSNQNLMATKIRLQRHGRKGYPFYKIVIADSRAPRDGKFIERIGSYNPNTNPATIDLNFERALYWMNVGAQPTDTVRNILSREGVMMMKHLQGGVKKGAFDEATAQRKFEEWKSGKDEKLNKTKASMAKAKEDAAKAALEAEKKANQAKAEAVAEKRAAAAKAKAEAEAAGEEPATETEATTPEAEATPAE